MQSTILIPLDGSQIAEQVLPHALMLARTQQRALLLVRVISPTTVVQSYQWPMVTLEAIQAATSIDTEPAATYLKTLAQSLNKTNVHVSTTVLVGDPAEAIIEYVREHKAICEIALTTHGRTGVKRWLPGSVAEKLIQATPVPVFVVRANPTPQTPALAYRSITVPLDGSAFAEQALGMAQLLADWYGATLNLVSVIEPVIDSAMLDGHAHPLWQVAQQHPLQAKAHIYLDHIAERLKQRGFNVETCVLEGTPAENIAHYAEQHGTDVVVMTTHGRSGLQRLWMGSVATRVVRTSSCPVLLLRGFEHQPKPDTAQAALAQAS